MSIDSAIGGLNPWYWWKLGEDSGTIALDSSGHGINGTYSGDLQLGVTGPTLDDKAVRLYATGQVISPALGLSAWNSISIGMWLSAPAQGTVPTQTDIWNLGTTTDRHARGVWSFLTSGSVGVQNISVQGTGVTSAMTTGMPFPQAYWWWLVFIRDAIGNTMQWKVGPTLSNSKTGTPGVVWQTTDQLLIRGDTAVAVSNVAVWDRALTQAEVTNIANQVQPWPYQVPTNQIPVSTGGGTTDLTPVLTDTDQILANQAATQTDVTQIRTQVNSLATTQVPAVATQTTAIQQYVQRTFQTAAGVGLSTPIGQLLAHPDRNFLSLTATPFLLSGRGALTPPVGGVGQAMYGIAWATTTVPPQAGLRDGAIQEYIGRLVQFVTLHYLAGSTTLYASEVADFRYDNFYWLWDNYAPHEVLYDVTPGFELTCWWIQLG